MARLNYMNDVGAPVAVVGADIAASKLIPKYAAWTDTAIAVGGFVAYSMGYAGDFVKNMAIAATPAAVNKLVAKTGWINSGVRRYPAPANASPFQGARLV